MYKRLKMDKSNREIATEIIEWITEIGINTETIKADTIKRYLGEALPEDAPLTIDQLILCYLGHLWAAAKGDKSIEIPKPYIRQVKQAYKDGMLSMYMSVVACSLGRIFDTETKYDFILGYVETTQQFPKWGKLQKYIPLPSIEINMIECHAIATANGRVLGICYDPEQQDDSLIYGTFPRGAAMYGWEMNTAKAAFIQYFIECTKIDLDTFLTMHAGAFKVYINQLNK
nr:hypothetical protein [uncultured Niameybacter sp.]